jgi:hypothetical protein
MSQQSQTQKDTDTPAQDENTYGTGQKKPDATGFKTPTTDYHQPTLTPNPIATKPEIAQTVDDAPANVPAPDFQNDIAGIPTMSPDNVEVDAKRDASPDQKPAPLNTNQPSSK